MLRAVVAAHGPAYGVVAHSLGSMVAALAMRDGIVPQRAVYVAPMIDVTSYGEPFVRTLGGGPRIWAKFVKRVESRLGLRLSYFDIAAMADEVITPPLLIVHDRDDYEASWDASGGSRRWPDAGLLTTDGLGHNRILIDPAVVAAAVAFIRSGTGQKSFNIAGIKQRRVTGSWHCGKVPGGLMLAAWYERQGAAHEVLQIGEQPDPGRVRRGPGECQLFRRESG